jgi:hypothetical protein
MNPIGHFLLLFVLVAVSGCGTTTTTGRKFDASKIHDIQKGVTTSEELIRLLGEPLSKSATSANQAVWEYSWKKATTETKSSPEGPVTTIDGDKKTLTVSIKNGVVINYVYKDEPYSIEKLNGGQ